MRHTLIKEKFVRITNKLHPKIELVIIQLNDSHLEEALWNFYERFCSNTKRGHL